MEICGLNFPKASFDRHLIKRIKYGHISSREDYIKKLKDTLRNAGKFYLLRELADCKEKLIFFNSKDNWTVLVLFKEKRILTCFLLDEAIDIISYYKNKDYDLYLRKDCVKGSLREVNKNENSKYSRFVKKVQNRCRTS